LDRVGVLDLKYIPITLANDQLDTQISNTFTTILYMFRAISCSFSGGQIVLIQHLVSSLSVSDRPVHRLRKSATRRAWKLGSFAIPVCVYIWHRACAVPPSVSSLH